MRVWSIHPKYLDPQGLVALWRETLLARAVLKGETKGYRNHPQLQRFQQQADPVGAVEYYLQWVYAEAVERGYRFDPNKVQAEPLSGIALMTVTEGQLAYEWAHLLRKLALRSPQVCERWAGLTQPECHPMFVPVAGAVASWEKTLP